MRMIETSIYIDREDVRKVEREERALFVREVLEFLDLPNLDEIWPEEAEDDEQDSVEQKIKLRELLGHFGVDIVDDGDRGIKVYFDKKVIAEWKKPFVVLRKDMSDPVPSRRLFAEMQIKYWSVFHDQEQQQQQQQQEDING
jgi:hypothetical protein